MCCPCGNYSLWCIFGENNKYLSFLSINKKTQGVQNAGKSNVQAKNNKPVSSNNKNSNNVQEQGTVDNSLGTTPGNLINCSFVLGNNGVVYYSNFLRQFRLYKMSQKGANPIQLNDDDSGYFTQNGDYIYYQNGNDGKMYSIKNDGSEKRKISDTPVSCTYNFSWELHIL